MKNILTIYLLIFSLLTFGQSKTQIGTDTVIIGKPGSTANKRIKLGSQEIRSNTATSKLEYTHDGVTYKPIGSGSGAGGSSGGINLIANESFEDPITTGWSNTGGTFTQESYLNGTETDAKFARFVATAAGQYFETPLITVPTNFSGGCEADFKKVSVSADDLFKVEILDSSSNVLATANVKKSSWVKFPTLNTTCPTPGSQFRLRVTSLAAGTIDSDYGYLGSNQNTVNIAQAKFFGGVKISNCTAQWSLTSTTYTNFTPQSACSYTYYGNAVADTSFGTTQLPAVKFSQLPPGEYLIQYEGLAGNNSSTSTSFRFSDGTNSTDADSSLSTNNFIPGFSGKLTTNTSQSNVTIQVQAKAGTGSPLLHGTSLYSGTIRVWYFPSTQEQAVNTEQSSWFIDANIGGSNPSITTSAVTSYSEITDASLDLVINSSKGSASAEIACASGTASSGLTCTAANESVGIAFIPPYAGQFEACFDVSAAVADNQNFTLALNETSNTSSAILSEGGYRMDSANTSAIIPRKVCGTFKFTDTSKKTLRLMFEKSANTSAMAILADRGATAGQRDIHVMVRPLLSAYNRPILTGDQVTTPNTTKQKICAFGFGGATYNTSCISGSCTIYQAGSSCGVAVSRNALGQYTYTFPANTWNGLNYFCGPVGLPTYTSGTHAPNQYESSAKTSTVFSARFNNQSGDSDVAGNIICYGQGN